MLETSGFPLKEKDTFSLVAAVFLKHSFAIFFIPQSLQIAQHLVNISENARYVDFVWGSVHIANTVSPHDRTL